jgi:hypothetical protein
VASDEEAAGEIDMSLEERLEELGRRLAERESKHAEALEQARDFATRLHGTVEGALGRFHTAAADVSHLKVELSAPRIDDKHLHAVEFELARGRHKAIVTVKSQGEITFVGPFRSGKTEGPCRSFPLDAADDIQAALGDFLVDFLEAAAAP